MRDIEYFLLAIMSSLLALTALPLGGGKLMLTPPISLQEILGVICLFGVFSIGSLLLVMSIRRTRKARKGGGSESEPLDSQHALVHKDRQVSINIGINSGDFTDDRMSTKRMNDSHRLVKNIRTSLLELSLYCTHHIGETFWPYVISD